MSHKKEDQAEWRKARVSQIFEEVTERGDSTQPLLAATQHAGVILKSDVEWRTVTVSEAGKENFKKVSPNNFVISLRSFEGGIEHSPLDGIISSAYSVLRMKSEDWRFFRWYFKSHGFIQSIQVHKKGIREGQSIAFGTMKNDELIIPPLAEQEAIADFLDRETALIDRRLALIERKKDLLGELKKSVVHEAVTKGLDRGVAMKDSGVDWIGEIPGAWRVGRVKEGLHPKKKINKDRQEGNILSLTMKGVLRNNSEKPIGLVPSDYASYQVFEKNELVFKLIDLENTKTSRVGLVWERGIMSPAYIRMAISTSMIADYAYWLFIDWWNRDVFQLHGGNGVRSSLSASDLLKLQIAMPPIAEQKAIVEHLGRETSRFDKMAKLLARQEELLKEQRKALIHEVVTGKRRVI